MTRMKWLALLVVASFLLIIPMGAVPAMAQYYYDYNDNYYNPGNRSNIGTGAAIGGAAGLLFGDGLGGVLEGAAIGAGTGALTAGGQTGESARTGAYIGGGLGLLTDGIGGAFVGGGLGAALGGLLAR